MRQNRSAADIRCEREDSRHEATVALPAFALLVTRWRGRRTSTAFKTDPTADYAREVSADEVSGCLSTPLAHPPRVARVDEIPRQHRDSTASRASASSQRDEVSR